MKFLVTTKAKKAGGCADRRGVAFNSLTTLAVRHSQLLLPVSCRGAFLGCAAELS